MSALTESRSLDDSLRSAVVYWIDRASMASTSACVRVWWACVITELVTIGKVILTAIKCIN